VYGYSFCAAARSAFELITRNVVRVVVVDKISDFILFSSRLIITIVATVVGNYWLLKYGSPHFFFFFFFLFKRNHKQQHQLPDLLGDASLGHVCACLRHFVSLCRGHLHGHHDNVHLLLYALFIFF